MIETISAATEFASAIFPPWLIPIIAGAGGSFIDNIFSRNSADSAYDAESAGVEANERIAAENLAFQREQLEWAKQMRREDQLGRNNEFLDAQYFDDDRGWITDLSPGSQSLAEAGRRQDTLNRTDVDAQNRERSDRLATTQRGEAGIAEGLLNEYRDITPQTGTDIAQTMYASRGADRNEFLRGANEAQFRTQQRTGGNSNAAALLASQASNSANASRFGQGEAMRTQLAGGEELTNNRRGAVGDQYNNFRDKSVQAWNPAFNPTSAPNFAQGSLAGSNAAMMQALGNQNVPYRPTDYSGANRDAARNSANSNFLADLGKFGMIGFDKYFGGQGDRQQGDTAYGGNNEWFS
jgi:hypothetical protein